MRCEEAGLLGQGTGVGDHRKGVHLQAAVVVEAHELVHVNTRVQLEPAPAVSDDHVERRDRCHVGRPRPRVLGSGHVPGDHPLAAAAYKHLEVARDPDPVDVEHAVELAVEDGHGPDPPQNSAVLCLKERPPPGIMACESLERSHPRNSSSLVAVSSHPTVVDAPQAVHLHRWDPDEVLPLRLVRPPR